MNRRSYLRAMTGGLAAATLVPPTLVRAQQPGTTGGAVQPVLPIERFGGRADDPGFDNAPALERAIAAAQTAGLAVRFGPGTYYHRRPVLIENRIVGRADGPLIVGAGRERTRLRYASDHFATFRGIGPASERKAAGGRFFYGGGIENLTIDGQDGRSGPALRIVGWWDALFDQVRFRNIPGTAVQYEHDRQFHPNPDWSASGRNRFIRSEFLDCAEWGIRTAPIASHTLTVDGCLFNYCLEGGIFLAAPGSRVVGTAFGRIGWRRVAGRPTAYRPDAAALVIGNDLGGSQLSRFHISLCEFDSASGAYCVLQNARLVRMTSNRFIFRALAPSDDRLLPRHGVAFAPQNVDVAAASVTIDQLEYRVDANVPGEQPVLYWLANGANVRGIDIDKPLLNGPAGKVREFAGDWARYRDANSYALPDTQRGR